MGSEINDYSFRSENVRSDKHAGLEVINDIDFARDLCKSSGAVRQHSFYIESENCVLIRVVDLRS